MKFNVVQCYTNIGMKDSKFQLKNIWDYFYLSGMRIMVTGSVKKYLLNSY